MKSLLKKYKDLLEEKNNEMSKIFKDDEEKSLLECLVNFRIKSTEILIIENFIKDLEKKYEI